MKRNTVIPALFIGCTLILSGCGQRNYVKTDLPATSAAASGESMSAATEAPEPVKIENPDNQAQQKETGKNTSAPGITAALHTYKEGNVSIQYPAVSGMEDGAMEEKINTLLKSNALEILKAYSVNSEKDSLSLTAKVNSVDRKRVTVVYTGLFSGAGAAHPINVFFTNTVDMSLAKDIRLTDYADPNLLAEYIRSDGCQLYDASPELTEALIPYFDQTRLETYAKMFQKADFPMEAPSSGHTPAFPESFSYEDHGTIIVSIPVPHSLGDFALIKYTPETK
ncbi:MAG TPA: DUF4163 domain-containing protein [Lachnoclostridium sp.]|uniref:DUF4163 domain-containing protein n=1 Tax=Lacrimispora sp. TaxID=2719234 RepID=UPI000ECBC5E0|nr:DUF4163 domain-containing protein [Lacrimispora sp.]HCD44770.1 DUF4163 domain-containing protein [Lachnoclostridium sp.]